MTDGKKGTILVVDDQDGIRESMAGILDLEGYEIYSFEDGFKAIEKAREVSFDIAFLDVKMPKINGVDVFRGVKKLRPETVFYMMTAFAEDELLNQALNEGVCDLIHKPFEMEQILQIVEATQRRLLVTVIHDAEQVREPLRKTLVKHGFKSIPLNDAREVSELMGRKSVDIILLKLEKGTADADATKLAQEISGDPDARVVMRTPYTLDGVAGEMATVVTRRCQEKSPDLSPLHKTVADLLNEISASSSA